MDDWLIFQILVKYDALKEQFSYRNNHLKSFKEIEWFIDFDLFLEHHKTLQIFVVFVLYCKIYYLRIWLITSFFLPVCTLILPLLFICLNLHRIVKHPANSFPLLIILYWLSSSWVLHFGHSLATPSHHRHAVFLVSFYFCFLWHLQLWSRLTVHLFSECL